MYTADMTKITSIKEVKLITGNKTIMLPVPSKVVLGDQPVDGQVQGFNVGTPTITIELSGSLFKKTNQSHDQDITNGQDI
jgi:hypothetical protein